VNHGIWPGFSDCEAKYSSLVASDFVICFDGAKLVDFLGCENKSPTIDRIRSTDKNPAYVAALKEMKDEGKCDVDLNHRQIKYLNNRLEADHCKLKRLIKPVRRFKSMKTAYATIKDFEVMRMFRKGQMRVWQLFPGVKSEVYLVEKQFGLDSKNAYGEFWKSLMNEFEAA